MAVEIIYFMSLAEIGAWSCAQRLIGEGKNPTPSRVADLAGVTPQAINRYYKSWIERGFVERKGTPRGGYSYQFNHRDFPRPLPA